MKKFVASVGLVALGASGIQAVHAQGLTAPDTSKPWSIAATLRGFYDDNIDSVPERFARDSFGFEVSPSATLGWSTDQTSINLGYTYSYKWFDKKPLLTTGHDRQEHLFNLALSHAFTERYQIGVHDSFALGQEPDVLRTGNAYQTFQPVPGDNYRNDGGITFDAQLTRELGMQLGYDNAYYNYSDHGANLYFDPFFGPAVSASLSGVLDRMEQSFHIDGKWLLQPQTSAVLGYQFTDVDYIGDEPILVDAFGHVLYSDSRNSRNHYVYVGADHMFRPDLTGSVRVGGRFSDYYNSPNDDSETSPFAKLSLTYTYLPESYAQLGFTYDRSATDLIGLNGATSLTLDQDAAVVFGSIHHRIAPNLFGTLLGQFQNSSFNGGAYNNETERFYVLGVNVEYQFTRNFSAEVGYDYDKLDSDVGRSFDRNRVYLGVTARY